LHVTYPEAITLLKNVRPSKYCVIGYVALEQKYLETPSLNEPLENQLVVTLPLRMHIVHYSIVTIVRMSWISLCFTCFCL